MIYVISKATFGSYNVRDIQFNANWDICPYSDYAVIPDSMVDGILATQGYCDIALNSDGTEVVSFTARTIPSVPEECLGNNTVLSVNGVKADSDGNVTIDAADVGAAPSGYGLGEVNANAPEDNDANKAICNGVYTIYASTANGLGVDGVLDVSSRTYGYATQTFKPSISKLMGCVAQRQQKNHTWGEWEWVNPPMELGVEYRTTDRWNGKTVFATALSIGNLPNASSKNITFPAYIADFASAIVSAVVVTDSGAYVNVVDSGTTQGAWVKTDSDYSSHTAKLIVKYVCG